MGELEAVHLQQAEEGVPHHISYAVVRLHQTAVKPAAPMALVQEKASKETERMGPEWAPTGRAFCLKVRVPTCCRSRSETW